MRDFIEVQNQDELALRSIEAAKHRRSQFVESLPEKLSDREDVIRIQMSRENASSRSKIRKIYHLVDELLVYSEPYTACNKGCSSCCKISVTISQIEARLIGERIGLKPATLKESKMDNTGHALARPCPFLKNEVCSIYDARPYVCRQHVCFDVSPYWCDPTRTHVVKAMPLLRFSGAEGAVLDIGKFQQGGVFADIRDFFPHGLS